MIVGRLKSIFGASDNGDQPTSERRVDPRRKVILRAEVFPVLSYAEMTVKNVSRTGLAGDTGIALEVSQPLLFSVAANEFHLGTVKWVHGRRFGLDLDNAMAILGYEDHIDSGTATTHRPRARRYDVDVGASIAVAATSTFVTVRDVSQSGFRIESRQALNVGQQVIIKIRDRPLIVAFVRWAAGGKIGMKTAERIATLRLVYADE